MQPSSCTMKTWTSAPRHKPKAWAAIISRTHACVLEIIAAHAFGLCLGAEVHVFIVQEEGCIEALQRGEQVTPDHQGRAHDLADGSAVSMGGGGEIGIAPLW